MTTAARLFRDSVNRAARTLYQLVVVSVVIDVAPLLLDALDTGDPVRWSVLGKAAARSVLAAVIAFMMRRYGDGSPIPTPTPPAP